MSTTVSAKSNWKDFLMFTIRVMIVHTITYFLFGIIMSNVFNYAEVFQRAIIRDYMIPMEEHNIILGPFLQPLRGLIFAIGLWPFHDFLIQKKRGWLYLWGLIVTMGILSTPAASPSSIEGVLYSKLPMWYHLMGLPEILLQTLVFSIWLVWWERQAAKGPETAAKKGNPLVSEIVKAIMTACFAYIGYAVGGLLLAARANANAVATGSGGIDIGAAGADFKMQFMFVVAFLVNAITVFWIGRKWPTIRMPLWGIFLLFWFIDAAVPWLYQTIVFGSSHIPTAIMLGFFPAVIITASMKMSYRKPAMEARTAS